MPLLTSRPGPTVARTVPTGVASASGQTYYLARPGGGLDAVDAASGAISWTSAAASIPILEVPGALLAIAGADLADDSWAGAGRLVAIDLAAPHAARAGEPFALPLVRHRLLDVRVDRVGWLEASWQSEDLSGGPRRPPPAPMVGVLRADLGTGFVAVTAGGTAAPESVRQALAGADLRLPPWRTQHGWSALVLGPGPGPGGGLELALRHFPTGQPARKVALVVTAQLGTTGVIHADNHHVFLRACQPAGQAPPGCELRIHDAEVGQRVETLVDAAEPGPERIEPPLALIGCRLLGVRNDPRALVGGRVLVAFDLDQGGAMGQPVWRRSLGRGRLPDLLP